MMGVCFKDSPCALFGINCNDSALTEYSNRSNEFENVAVRDRLYHGQKAMPMSITTSSLQTPGIPAFEGFIPVIGCYCQILTLS